MNASSVITATTGAVSKTVFIAINASGASHCDAGSEFDPRWFEHDNDDYSERKGAEWIYGHAPEWIPVVRAASEQLCDSCRRHVGEHPGDDKRCFDNHSDHARGIPGTLCEDDDFDPNSLIFCRILKNCSYTEAMRLLWVMMVVALVGVCRGQGVVWDQQYAAPNVQVARHSNGDLYVVQMRINNGFAGAAVDHLTPSGFLVSRAVHNSSPGSFTYSKIVGTHFSGNSLMFVANNSNSGGSPTKSYLYRYDLTSKTFNAIDLISEGSYVSIEGFGVGQTTYCVVGKRNSDSNHIAEVRRLSDNVVLRLTTSLTKPMSNCVLSGADTYYTNAFYNAGVNERLVIHRLTSTTTNEFEAVGGHTDFNVRIALSNDGNYIYSSTSYYLNPIFHTYVRAFRISTESFMPEYHASGTESSRIVGIFPISSSRLIVHEYQNIRVIAPTGAIVFSLPFVEGSYWGALGTDASGNGVALAREGDDLVFKRFDSAGLILNRFAMTGFEADPYQLTVDAAGQLRALYRTTTANLESFWNVGQFNQATLILPGPYTVGGDTLIGTINLGGVAPAGGATFQLISSNPAATVPSTVVVPAGASSVPFTVNTSPVATNTKPTINASYKGLILQSNFDLAAPLIRTVTAAPQVQYGGNNIIGTARLTGDAPTGGKVVTLTSSNTAKATVPPNTTIAAGVDAKTFIITTMPTLVNASSVITATTGAVSKTVFIAINAPIFQSVTLGSSAIQGGTSTTMTLTLNAIAPSGYTVTLISGSQAFVQLPSSYAVPAGTTSVTLPVTTSIVSSSTPITLVAYRGPYVKTVTLTLTP